MHEKTDEDDHNVLIDAGSATEINESDDNSGNIVLSDPFIFTEALFCPQKDSATHNNDDNNDTHMKDDSRANILMA